VFDGLLVEREPDHYRRTFYEADMAFKLIGLVRGAFIEGKLRWSCGNVADKQGWTSPFRSVFHYLDWGEMAYHAALRYVAAAIVRAHAARPFYDNVRIIEDYAKRHTLDEVMRILVEAQKLAKEDITCKS
jgi:hypothetical protein